MDPKKRLIGAKSKADGALFESLIDVACEYYRSLELAHIEKTPEPMTPIKRLGNGRFIAIFKKKAQPDYKGTLKGGLSICFEAKHTDKERIDQSRVTKEQQEILDIIAMIGGRCYVFVSFGLQDFFFVPWEVWKNMKEMFGRKYATSSDLHQWKVEKNNREVLLFLERGEIDVD